MKEENELIRENDEHIKELCRRVEETAGLKAVKSKHFENLVVLIYERTGTLLSPTTLKRIWGYLKEKTVTRRSTLDLLAQFCGWHKYDDFLKGYEPEIESGFMGMKVLNAERDMKNGDVVMLMWEPSRICNIRYLGDSRWIVTRTEGTRLSVGDTFRCSTIMSGEPLYLYDLVHDGVKRGIYVCGRRNGVRFTVGDSSPEKSE